MSLSGPGLKIILRVFLASAMVVPGVLFRGSPGYSVSPANKNIIERNPFDPKRGQEGINGQEGAISSGAGELEKKYSVYGVILAGKSRYAFIKPVGPSKRGEGAKLRKVSIGDLVGGWTIKDINGKGIVLVSGDDHVLLKVFGSPKAERQTNRPVGIATPRAVPIKPLTRHADRERIRAVLERAEKGRRASPHIVYPRDEKGRPVINPFLKALKKAREKEKRH